MMKTWKIDAGNSSSGPVGFVVYGIQAETAEAALAHAQTRGVLPECIETTTEDDDALPVTIVTYFNPAALTLDNIEEDDDESADETPGLPDPR